MYSAGNGKKQAAPQLVGVSDISRVSVKSADREKDLIGVTGTLSTVKKQL